MKYRRFLPLLLVALPAHALDEYQPAEEGVIAVDVMNSLDWGRGSYDPDGSLQDPVGSPFTWSPGVQMRLGLPNLTEISLVVPAAVLNKDALGEAEGDWGFYESSLGFKLGVEDWGVAVVGGVDFPIGTRKVIGDDLRWRFTAGGIGHWERKKFHIDGSVTWTVTPADDKGVRRGDEWKFIARPAWQVNDIVSPYLGGVATLTTPGKINDKRDGVYSHLLTLQPGAIFDLSEEWSCEVQAPVTVVGDYPEAASAGVYLGVTYNLIP